MSLIAPVLSLLRLGVQTFAQKAKAKIVLTRDVSREIEKVSEVRACSLSLSRVVSASARNLSQQIQELFLVPA